MPGPADTHPTGSYDPETYWSRIADDLARRNEARAVAGIDSPYFRYNRSRFLERFLSRIDVQGKTVLEVGCGPGGNLAFLADRRPGRLVGVDVSEAMLDLARETTSGVAVPVEFVKSNGTELPLPDRSMDLSLTVTVLQHNPDDTVFESLVSEICRVTAHEIILIEDTARRQVTPEPQIIRRPVDAYAAACAMNGYKLVRKDFLQTRATYLVDRIVNGLGRRLGLKAQGGERAPRPLWEVLAIANALARPFDTIVPDGAGLTRMIFHRVDRTSSARP